MVVPCASDSVATLEDDEGNVDAPEAGRNSETSRSGTDDDYLCLERSTIRFTL